MEKKIKIVYIEVDKEPEIIEIENKLEAMQNLVGGYIEMVYLETGTRPAILICNEEGIIMGLEPNRVVPGVGTIHGPFFICSEKGEDFASISEEKAKKFVKYFGF